jgi:hypothetical protein
MIELLRIIFLKMRYTITLFLFLIPLITSEAQIGNDDWPLFRGKADLAGKIESELPVSPKLLWSIKNRWNYEIISGYKRRKCLFRK